MVYDSTAHKVVLFGGRDIGAEDDDTWTYDLATNTWTNVNPGEERVEAGYVSFCDCSGVSGFSVSSAFEKG